MGTESRRTTSPDILFERRHDLSTALNGSISESIETKSIPEADDVSTISSSSTRELWRRELAGRLQITHVDRYGKLHSELEPEPDKSSSSGISQAVKKFMSKSAEEEKIEEEMAWQVAESIVNDVTRITSANWT